MKYLIFLYFLFHSISFANTGIVQTPFQLKLDKNIFENILFQSIVQKSINGSIPIQLDDFTIQDPFYVHVAGLHLNINYAFEKANRSENKWHFQTKNISAELFIDRIDATQIIRVGNGGSEMDIRLDGFCKNVRMQLPPELSTASGEIHLNYTNNRPNLNLNNFSAAWKEGSWRILEMHCEGTRGFDQVIAKTAMEKLQKINPFLPDIQKSIQNILNAGLQDPISLDFMVSSKPKVDLHLESKPFEWSSDSQVLINGEAKFIFSLPKDHNCSASIKKNIDNKVEKNSFIIPFQALKSLLNCSHLANALHFLFDSRKVPVFRNLQKSELERNYVWPDLGNFDPQAIFQFIWETREAPLISNEKRMGDHQFSAKINIPFKLSVLAPKSTYLPYLNFYSRLQGTFFSEIKDGSFKGKIMGSLPLDAEWDKSYLMNYATDQNLSLDIVEEKGEETLKAGFSLPIPAILGPGIELKIKDADLIGDLLQIRLTHKWE